MKQITTRLRLHSVLQCSSFKLQSNLGILRSIFHGPYRTTTAILGPWERGLMETFSRSLVSGLWTLDSGQNNLLNLYISGWWLNPTGIVAFRTFVLLFRHIGVDRLVYDVKMVSKKHFIPSGSPANGGSSPSSAEPPYHLPGANIGIIVLFLLLIPLSIYGVYYIHKHLRTSRRAAKNAAMNRARYAYGVEVPAAGEVRGGVVRMGDIPTATSRAAVMNIILRARRMPFISWCRKHHLQISQGLFFASTTSTSRFLPGSLLWICGKPSDDGIIIYHCVYEILSISEHPRFDYNRDYEYPLGTSTTNSSHTTGKAIAPAANASNTSDSSATLNEEEGPDQDLEEQLKRLREKHAYKETFHEQPTYESTFQDEFRLSLEAGIHHIRHPERREAIWKGLGWCFFEAYSDESKVRFHRPYVYQGVLGLEF